MNLSVLIPYRAGDPYHDRNWAWTERRWRALLPDVELVVESDDGGSSPAEFNHPLALNRAAEKATHDVLLMADIDIVPDPDWIERAVRQVERGAPFVVASEYHKLGQVATSYILAGGVALPLPRYKESALVEPPILSSCAPPLVIPKEGWEAAGGYDERIAWWGADDGVFRVAVDALWGLMERCEGAAVHLWHPEVPFAHERQDEQQKLVFRYLEAAGDLEKVREVQAA